MRKLILPLILLSVQFAFGQGTISIKEGVANGGNAFGYIIGHDKICFYTKDGNTIKKFNNENFNVEYTTELELEGIIKKEKMYPLEGITRQRFGVLDGEVTMVYDMWNKSSDKRTIYVNTISSTGQLSARKELQSCEYTAPFYVYDIIFSKDNTKFAVMQLLKDNKTFTVYDTKSQSVLASGATPVNYNGAIISSVTIKGISTDKSLSVDFTTGGSADASRKVYAAILKPDGKLENVRETISRLDNTKYTYSNVQITSTDENMVMAGMYMEKVDNYDKKHPPEFKTGTFLALMDPATGKVISESYNLLEKDVYDKLTYKIVDDSGKHLTPGEKSLITRKVVQMNGNYYVIAENYYEVYVSSGNSGKTFHISRELLVSKYDSKGRYHWMRIIPKLDNESGSYDMMAKNNMLYFFYLDNKKNDNVDIVNYKPEDIEQTRLHEGVTTCTTIDEQGNMKKKAMDFPADKKYVYQPENYDFLINGDNGLLIHFINEGGKFAMININ